MALFWGPRRQLTEERALSGDWGWAPTSYPVANFAQVDPTQSALNAVAVGATVDLICSIASELPVGVYMDGADGMANRRALPANLLDPDTQGGGLEDWSSRLLMSWLMRGNAYGRILETDRRGNPRYVDLINPDDVSVIMQDGTPRFYVKGVEQDGTFLHWPINREAGRILGMSPIQRHAATIGVSLSSTAFGRQWFTDGAHPSALLVNEGVIDQATAKTAKERFLATMSGTREPLVLGKGWDYKPLSLSPEESQFLETQRWTAAESARAFGPGFAEILGYESGGSMTYANVVDRRTDLLVLSMDKWITRLDRIRSLLVPPQQRVMATREAMLRTATMDRYKTHAVALQNKWRTVNEVRALEDLPPVPWGDVPVDTITWNEGAADGNADV